MESKITTRISRCESKSISIIYKSAPSHGRIGKVHGYETRQSAGRVSPEELGPQDNENEKHKHNDDRGCHETLLVHPVRSKPGGRGEKAQLDPSVNAHERGAA